LIEVVIGAIAVTFTGVELGLGILAFLGFRSGDKEA